MSLKNKLKNNQLTIGSWVMMSDTASIEVLGLAGFEWLAIDIEHTSIDLKTTEELIRTIQSKKMKALVRIHKNEEVIIKKVLDMGADGIIVPMVCSKEDALQAVKYAKYPPQGIRGVGLYRATEYGTNFEKYKKWVSEEIVIIAQIEHIDAVRNIDGILSVNEIDGILVGPYDLSGSLGFPGDFEKNDFKAAIKEILSKCKKNKVPSGYHVVDSNPKKLKLKIDQGFTFLAFGIDYLFLRDAASAGMLQIKNMLK
jgi:2-dehydro-3-deoxyglucarate aldolase